MLDEAGRFRANAFERAMAELDNAEAAKVWARAATGCTRRCNLMHSTLQPDAFDAAAAPVAQAAASCAQAATHCDQAAASCAQAATLRPTLDHSSCPALNLSSCPTLALGSCPTLDLSSCPALNLSSCPALNLSSCPAASQVGSRCSPDMQRLLGTLMA